MGQRSDVVFVVMAGGRGDRLWPLVRSSTPKVCLPIEGKRTLLEMTLDRLTPLANPENVLIVTTASQLTPIRRILPRAFRRALLVEPEPKNTAACLGLAATVLARRHPSAILVALPADQWIQPVAAFQRSVLAAIETARAGEQLVTIGIQPTRAHQGLGYIRAGAALPSRQGCRVFRLARFVEKPSLKTAQRLLQGGRAYWNVGIFVGGVETFLTHLRRHLPQHAKALEPLGRIAGQARVASRAAAAYRRLSAVSFDDGVMAHQRNSCMVEGRFAWEDLGSWDSVLRIGGHSHAPLTVNCRNVRTFRADGHLIATVGLEDVIVVHTPDATLVCRARDAQAVRTVVARLSTSRKLARYR